MLATIRVVTLIIGVAAVMPACGDDAQRTQPGVTSVGGPEGTPVLSAECQALAASLRSAEPSRVHEALGTSRGWECFIHLLGEAGSHHDLEDLLHVVGSVPTRITLAPPPPALGSLLIGLAARSKPDLAQAALRAFGRHCSIAEGSDAAFLALLEVEDAVVAVTALSALSAQDFDTTRRLLRAAAGAPDEVQVRLVSSLELRCGEIAERPADARACQSLLRELAEDASYSSDAREFARGGIRRLRTFDLWAID